MNASRAFAPRFSPVSPAALLSVVLSSSLGLSAQGDRAAEPVHLGLRGANFLSVDARRANFAGRDLREAVFRNATLTGAVLYEARIDGTDLRGATGLTAAQLTSARWGKVVPRVDPPLQTFLQMWKTRRVLGVNLDGALWWSLDRSGINFRGASLRRAVLIECNLRNAVLRKVDLSGALLAGADLSGADLRGALGLTAGQLVSARWDPRHPPAVDLALQVSRDAVKTRRWNQLSLGGAVLWERDFAGATFLNTNLRKAVFIGANLRGANFRGANVSGVIWTDADLTGADFRGAIGLDVGRVCSGTWDPAKPPVLDLQDNLVREQVQNRRFDRSSIANANFWGDDFRAANFVGATVRDVVFTQAILADASFQNADVTGSSFARADLSGADFRGARGIGLAQLLSGTWDPARAPRVDAQFQGFITQWSKRRLRNVSPRGATLWGEDLSRVRLRTLDLSGVSLIGANLRGADLSRCDLSGAALSGADISGTDFRGSSISAKMILSAVWDPESPPILDTGLGLLRMFRESKQFQFDLVGACLQQVDPPGVIGLARKGDRQARFQRRTPPRLGIRRLVAAIRAGDLGAIKLDPR